MPDDLQKIEAMIDRCTDEVDGAHESLEELIERVEHLFKVQNGWRQPGPAGLQ